MDVKKVVRKDTIKNENGEKYHTKNIRSINIKENFQKKETIYKEKRI